MSNYVGYELARIASYPEVLKAGMDGKTRLLFVDADETSFQVWQCMANVLDSLPPFEFHYASDATEALEVLEQIKPDVIVLNFSDEEAAEREVFLESLYCGHPPVVVTTDELERALEEDRDLIYRIGCGSLDGIHKTLIAAASLASRALMSARAGSEMMH